MEQHKNQVNTMISYQKLEEINIEETNASHTPLSSTHVIKDKLNKEKNLLAKSNYIKNSKLIILLILTHLTVWLIATPANIEHDNVDLLKIHFQKLEFKGIDESASTYVDLYDENFLLLLKNKKLISENSASTEQKIYQVLITETDTAKVFHFIDKKIYAFPTGFIIPKNAIISRTNIPRKIKIKQSNKNKLNHFQRDWEL